MVGVEGLGEDGVKEDERVYILSGPKASWECVGLRR
jgi:hypothetical protein